MFIHTVTEPSHFCLFMPLNVPVLSCLQLPVNGFVRDSLTSYSHFTRSGEQLRSKSFPVGHSENSDLFTPNAPSFRDPWAEITKVTRHADG